MSFLAGFLLGAIIGVALGLYIASREFARMMRAGGCTIDSGRVVPDGAQMVDVGDYKVPACKGTP